MRVIVVGGGLSGLFTASELTAAGIDVHVVEKAEEPGGVARTIERDGFQFEPAVGSASLPHPHLSPILDHIGAEMAPARPSGSARYLYTRGRLVELPASPKAVLSPIVPISARLRALAEPLARGNRPRGEESLREFCERRFGRVAGEMVAWLMATGVYAGDPGRLSADAAFPRLTRFEEEHGSVIRGALKARRDRPDVAPQPVSHVPVGGMATLARTAAGTLGDRYRGGFEVGSVRRDRGRWVVEGPETLIADSVVIACRPRQAGEMVDEELSAHLGDTGSAPVVVVGLGGSADLSVPSGFGALIGPREQMVSLGVLFESSYAPQRAPRGSWLLKVLAGGATNPELAGWETDRIVERICEETALVLEADMDPSFIEVVRHHPGIPQYDVGHLGWLDELDRLLSDRPGLHLAGWGYRGVGIARLATQAVLLSRRFAADA